MSKQTQPTNDENAIPVLLKGVAVEHLDVAKAMLKGTQFKMTTPKGVVDAKLIQHAETNQIYDSGKTVEYGEFDIVSNSLTGNVKAFQNSTFRVWTNDLLGNLARTRVKYDQIKLVK